MKRLERSAMKNLKGGLDDDLNDDTGGSCSPRGTICSFTVVPPGTPYPPFSVVTCCPGLACMGASGTIPTCNTP